MDLAPTITVLTPLLLGSGQLWIGYRLRQQDLVRNAARAEQAKATRQLRLIVDDTHAQVITLNGQTLGQLADSTETRRVDEMEPQDRSADERRHLAKIPLPDPEAPEAPEPPDFVAPPPPP